MKQEIKDKYTELFKESDLFRMKDIMEVNHKPHPYMIGPRHVTYASDNWSGMLSPEAIRAGEKANKCRCAVKGCTVPYDEHTADTVMFLQLKRNGTNEEANAFLKGISDEVAADGIDGFAMVETEEKFRITEDEERV